MEKRFQKFVEWFSDCKYVPVGSRCSICGKKLNFFHTGFWSTNVQNYNGHLSDGVIPRQIRLRTKPSTGEWFLWEQFILSDIRPPKSADPWA